VGLSGFRAVPFRPGHTAIDGDRRVFRGQAEARNRPPGVIALGSDASLTDRRHFEGAPVLIWTARLSSRLVKTCVKAVRHIAGRLRVRRTMYPPSAMGLADLDASHPD
jgi:hypothetical protein